MDVEHVCERLTTWIAGRVKEAGASGAVVGVSGGVDSAVVLALCRRALGDDVLALVLPCHSSNEDVEHARMVIERFGARSLLVDLSGPYDALMKAFGREGGGGRDLAVLNVRPRLRMIALYYHAALLNYLVVGTGNRSEISVGYFTKYGDGGVDLLPIGGLVKQEVRELARYLGVPDVIVDKPPTAGLWPGQTDEGEMGLKYEDIDRYLLTGQGDPDLIARIREKHERSEHKRRMPPIPEIH